MGKKRRTSRFVRHQRYSTSKSLTEMKNKNRRMNEKLDNINEMFNRKTALNEKIFNESVNEIGMGGVDKEANLLHVNIKEQLQKRLNEEELSIEDITEIKSNIKQIDALLNDYDIIFNMDKMEFNLDREETFKQGKIKLGEYENKFIDPSNMFIRIKESELGETYTDEDINNFLYVFYTYVLSIDVSKSYYFLYHVIFNILFDIAPEVNKEINKEVKETTLKNISLVMDKYKEL